MRFITPLLCLSLAIIANVSAEGTREVAPNSDILIGVSNTNDIAALHINHPSYNNFASYFNDDPHSRLYVHIKDPSAECIYLGFSFGHFNETSANPTRKEFEYRVVDPAGNVVFGPITIDPSGGNIQNWSQGFTGPMQLNGAGGYNAHHVTALDLSSQGWTGEGDYYVEFLAIDGADVLVDYWDISVADCSMGVPVEKKGRVWSYNWSFFAVNDFGFPNRPFNGAFYVCAPDPNDDDRAFITKIDFNGAGFRPAAFNVAFNSFGSMNSGNIAENRKSVESINSTQSEYAIFLNDPIELCETAIVGEIELLGVSRCNADEYCIKFTASKEGQVELLLDFDGPDDIFTPGTADVLIAHAVTAEQVGIPSCITWDGLDGLGNPLPEVNGTTIPVLLSYAQGIYHFPIYDAEFMTTGFQLEAVRPGGTIPLLSYDDSNISLSSGSGEPAVQISGCNVPCHQWTNFPNPNTPGFGNLNTINSWWFSQRIIRQDVLFLPGYYTCQVSGPQSICQGGITQISVLPQLIPSTVTAPDIISMNWSGPGIIGLHTGSSIVIGAEGDYHVDVQWVTGLGDTCSTSCDYTLVMDPPLTETIDTLIVLGQVLTINNEQYTEAGSYVQNLTNSFGCDSILTINVLLLQSVLYYDLEACESFTTDASPMDYTEFTPVQPEPLSCAEITGSIIFREPANMQKHSCTPGVNDGIAMCISSLDSCEYDAGNDASLIFEMTVTPDPDTAVHVTGITFFERSPVEYNWILGTSGPNNFPTRYGLRVLKNGVEIYRRADIATTNDWTLQTFDFLDEDEFIIEESAVFRFELLPYCLVGNGAAVAAWDVDEFKITASCAPFEGLNQIISGIVKTYGGLPVNNVEIKLTEDFDVFAPRFTTTNQEGGYIFTEVPEKSTCELTGYKNTDFLNGVSTLDLLYIQKHLLGKELFTSPYQYVAADANRSNNISAIDLLDLRKLILGFYTALPKNTSWRFGNIHASFAGYPWSFKETFNIEQLNSDVHDADFTAVKIGDVTGDAIPDVSSNPIVVRNAHSNNILFTDRMVEKGEVVKIDFSIDHQMDVAGMQFALNLNDMELVGIQSAGINISDENYAFHNGILIMSWTAEANMLMTKGAKLFSLTVVPNRNASLAEFITLANHSIAAEAYINDDLERVQLHFSAQKPSGVAENKLFQNQPNPFDQSTKIRFELANAGPATISIIDLSGRTIYAVTDEFEKGIQELEISSIQIGNVNGVLICQMQSGEFFETVKMVRL